MKFVIFLLLFNNSLGYLLNNKLMMLNTNGANSKHQIIRKNFNRLLPEVESKTILSQNNGYGILSTLNRKKNIKDYYTKAIQKLIKDKVKVNYLDNKKLFWNEIDTKKDYKKFKKMIDSRKIKYV